MKNEIKYYKILKDIKNDDNKQISIIEFDGIKYILKKVKKIDTDFINMLKNETNILYKLGDMKISPKIRYYKFDDSNNFIIVELIKGVPINRLKLETVQEKTSLMLKVIDVIKKIHKLNIIHCDLKPGNILLDLDKNVKLIDFGISVDDDKNYFKGYGSVKYCSKEQLTGEKIDIRTDIYALGVIFYELLLGKLPFEGTKKVIIEKKKKCEYNKTDNELLNQMFSKIFDDKNINRYKTVEEFEKDLMLFLSR